MQLQSIKVKNYKTYRDLDLNLDVQDGKSIILLGGKNGGGKTTLFDAICGALYGLTIDNESDFLKLVNDGYCAQEKGDKEIELEIRFTGYVVNTLKHYKLRRTYKLINGKPAESTRLDFDSTTYQYGTYTAVANRREQELAVLKIIKANLPSELSNYFLFDAMKTGDNVKAGLIDGFIKENIRSVMGFSKYSLLKEGAMKLLAEENSRRIQNQQDRQKYDEQVAHREELEKELSQLDKDFNDALAFSNNNRDLYQQALDGKQNDETIKDKIRKTEETIADITKAEQDYTRALKEYIPQLDQEIIVPKMAGMLEDEIAEIIANKEVVAAQNAVIPDTKIKDIVTRLSRIIEKKYLHGMKIDSDTLMADLKEEWQRETQEEDLFSFLDDEDVETLRSLIEGKYANRFLTLDKDREAVIARLADLEQHKQNLETYRKQLTGDNYSLIKDYEANEEKIKQLKLYKAAKQREMDTTLRKIDQYEEQVDGGDDPSYEVLAKLPDLFDTLADRLMETRKSDIEQRLKTDLNEILPNYIGMIGKVELTTQKGDIHLSVYHTAGNVLNLDGLSAGQKVVFMQVLLKALYEFGDYEPPIMVDTVLGTLDKETRDSLVVHYSRLSSQTILLSTNSEISEDKDFETLRPYIAKAYTLERDMQRQCTDIRTGYFKANL